MTKKHPAKENYFHSSLNRVGGNLNLFLTIYLKACAASCMQFHAQLELRLRGVCHWAHLAEPGGTGDKQITAAMAAPDTGSQTGGTWRIKHESKSSPRPEAASRKISTMGVRQSVVPESSLKLNLPANRALPQFTGSRAFLRTTRFQMLRLICLLRGPARARLPAPSAGKRGTPQGGGPPPPAGPSSGRRPLSQRRQRPPQPGGKSALKNAAPFPPFQNEVSNLPIFSHSKITQKTP